MRRVPTTLALLLALLPALAGCGRARYPRYYTLNLPAALDPPALEGVRASIAVQEFQSPVYLRQGPIVYRSTPEQIGFYEYHRWAVDPRMVVTNAIIDHLQASGQFSQVSIYDGHADDYIFSGKLEKLEEVDYHGGVKVEVALSGRITRGGTGATVWTNAVSESGSVSQRNVSGVVSEMNRTVDVAVNKLLSTIPASLTRKQ